MDVNGEGPVPGWKAAIEKYNCEVGVKTDHLKTKLKSYFPLQIFPGQMTE